MTREWRGSGAAAVGVQVVRLQLAPTLAVDLELRVNSPALVGIAEPH
jgi:hypothetical protein